MTEASVANSAATDGPTTERAARAGRAKFQHYAALDGLRGIAVWIVLIAHTTPVYQSGAFGVDIFFVLSGFLITSILAGELIATGRIAIGRFYARRFLRLLPALWLTLLTLSTIKLALGSFDADFGWDVVYAATYVMNWVYALGVDTSELLGHTWSLACEEQYYLVWPFLLILLHRTSLSWRQCAWLMTLLAIAVGIYRYWAFASETFTPMRIYRGLDTHCDGLLAGSALALAALSGAKLPGRAERLLHWAAPTAMLMLLVMPTKLGWFDKHTIRWGYTLVAILSVIVIWYLIHHSQSRLARALSVGPLVLSGKISYGLYLYHFPLLIWLEKQSWARHWAVTSLVCITATWALAWCSYTWIERPILGLKDRYFGSVVTKH